MHCELSSSSGNSNGPAPNGNGHARFSPDDSFPLVLVVDDYRPDLVAVERLLRRHGFRVICTETYAEAVRALDAYRFSAVVADYRLGDPKHDGVHLLTEAAAAQRGAARVLITSDPMGAVLADSVEGRWIDKANNFGAELVAVLNDELGR